MTQPLELDIFLAHHGKQILAPIGPYKEDVDDALSHFGVPGMRWGRRRGSSVDEAPTGHKKAKDMTDQELKAKTGRMENEKKYSSMVNTSRKGQVTKSSLDSAASVTREANNVVGTLSRRKEAQLADQKRAESKQLSDKELKDRINRLNMEQQYRNLTTRDVNVGKRNVEDVLSIAGSVLTVAATGVGLALTVKQLMGQ